MTTSLHHLVYMVLQLFSISKIINTSERSLVFHEIKHFREITGFPGDQHGKTKYINELGSCTTNSERVSHMT